MRFALRAVLVILASALPISLAAMSTWGGHRLAAGDSHPWTLACAPFSLAAGVAAAADQGGCCHFGGGVCGCRGGRVQCCKGNLTSSCPCGPRATPAEGPELRGPGRDGPPLQLRTAAFTNKTTGPPLFRMTASKAGEPVWFWLELDCPGSCLKQLTTVDPDLKVSVYWYFDPGSGPILRDDLKTDQVVAQEPEPPRVAIPVVLPAGNWIAEVGYGADRVCLKDDTCAFRLRVTK